MEGHCSPVNNLRVIFLLALHFSVFMYASCAAYPDLHSQSWQYERVLSVLDGFGDVCSCI